MKKRDVLDSFGEELIHEVRDYSIEQFYNSIHGIANTAERKIFKEEFQKLSEENKKFVEIIVKKTVDMSIHYFLWMIETSDNFKLQSIANNSVVDLAEVSDGLCGELYTNNGWIQKFSKYPSSEEVNEDEYLLENEFIDAFSRSSEEAKRLFVKSLNNKNEFETLKAVIKKIPPHILESLIEMTLSRSTLHKEKCEEIRKIMREKI